MSAEEWAITEGVTLRLVLVRHGEPESRARGRCYGKLDVGLSGRGVEQMRRTAELLETMPLEAVYSSPRRRALDSARIVASPHGLMPVVEDKLCEIDFGHLEGMTYEEVAQSYPQTYRLWMERPTELSFPGGESFGAMRRRVLLALRRIRERRHTQAVAIVSHAGTGRIILAQALRMKAGDIFRLDQSYAAVSIIDYYHEIPVVRLFNRQS